MLQTGQTHPQVVVPQVLAVLAVVVLVVTPQAQMMRLKA